MNYSEALVDISYYKSLVGWVRDPDAAKDKTRREREAV